MVEKIIESLVDGGKASAGPPLGPALGPAGVNIKQVIETINEKTKDFAGMKVPVKVIMESKEFKITVGTPPVSQLIKNELGIAKASGAPNKDKVADMKIEQAIKIAKMKMDSLNAKDNFGAVKTVIGSCTCMGILVEGKDPRETVKDIDNGMFKQKIESGKTELTAEELKALEEEKKLMAEETKKRHEMEEEKAKEIIGQMKGKDRVSIVHKLEDSEISKEVIEKLMPREGAESAEGGAEGGEVVATTKPEDGAKKEGA